MKVIYKQPGEMPVIKEVENSLRTLQTMVGGYIECFTIAEDAAIICNEEGRIHNLPFNMTFLGESFVGPIIFVGVNEDEFCDVPCEELLLNSIKNEEKFS